MRALVIRGYGGPEVLEVAEVATPAPGAGQVRVRVEAAGVNPVDLATRGGLFDGQVPARDSYVLGWDVAGVVDALGSGVDGFTVGQRVVGMSQWPVDLAGAQAEFVVLPAERFAAAPVNVSAVQAATLPLNGLTASQALDLLELPAGSTIAVTGAAGAVGGFAVQLAVARGLRVIGIAGPEDEELVRLLGAEVFVARTEDPAGAVRTVRPDGVDGVIDAALNGASVIGAVRAGGALAWLLPVNGPASEGGVRVKLVGVQHVPATLTELVGLVEAGKLTLRVADTYPLAQAVDAQERLAKGGVRGRLVLIP